MILPDSKNSPKELARIINEQLKGTTVDCVYFEDKVIFEEGETYRKFSNYGCSVFLFVLSLLIGYQIIDDIQTYTWKDFLTVLSGFSLLSLYFVKARSGWPARALFALDMVNNVVIVERYRFSKRTMNKLERQYLVENSELSRSSRLARRFDVELNIWSQRKFEIPISVIDAFKVVKSKAYEGTDIELVAQVGCYRIKLTDEILDESSAKVILNGVADLCKKPFEISNETPAYSPHELK